MNMWLKIATGCLFATAAAAQPIPLDTDVAVTLSAVPTTSLVTGDQVTFTATITNNGPVSLGYVAIIGPNIRDEFAFPQGAWTDCNIIISTADTETGPFWILEWFPNGVGTDSMAIGETRTCHFTLTITSLFPAQYSFPMFLPTYWSDLDEADDIATVHLSRAIAPVPSLGPVMLALLGTLIFMCAIHVLAARDTVSVSDPIF
jgi:hypothetical protein